MKMNRSWKSFSVSILEYPPFLGDGVLLYRLKATHSNGLVLFKDYYVGIGSADVMLREIDQRRAQTLADLMRKISST